MKLLKNVFNKQLLIIISCMVATIAIVIWWHTRPDTKTLKTAEQVFEIADSVRKSYINKPDYWGLNTDLAISNNMLTNVFYKNNMLVNALGKPILIGQGEEGLPAMPGSKSFDIVFTELSTEECVALATYNHDLQNNLGLLQITIVSGEGSQDFGWGREESRLPVSRTDAKKICKNNSKVIWTLE